MTHLSKSLTFNVCSRSNDTFDDLHLNYLLGFVKTSSLFRNLPLKFYSVVLLVVMGVNVIAQIIINSFLTILVTVGQDQLEQDLDYRSQLNGDLKTLLDVDSMQAQKNLEKLATIIGKKLGKEKSSIPETTMEKILNNDGQLSERIVKKVRQKGVLIVRNTIPSNLIHEWSGDLIQYLYNNQAFPKESNQTVYQVYWSKAQVAARQHPNMYKLQKALLRIWHTSGQSEVDVDLEQPVTYIDRLRIRQPNDSLVRQLPHIDGGGIERWQDGSYRKVYRHILEGDWKDFDPFEVDYRVIDNAGDTTFFRAFQGWLSLSSSKPGEGTLRVLPLLKEAIAYFLLRPFAPDVPSDLFPGTFPSSPLHVTEKWHRPLYEALVSIPPIGPGDTVWWHPDLIHAVESHHGGSSPNIVLCIPAGPECPINRHYLRKVRHALVMGTTPPDFPADDDYEVNFKDRATVEDLSTLGRTMMGLEQITGAAAAPSCASSSNIKSWSQQTRPEQ